MVSRKMMRLTDGREEGERANKEWNIAGLPETETPIRTLTEKVDGMEKSDDQLENEYGKKGEETC